MSTPTPVITSHYADFLLDHISRYRRYLDHEDPRARKIGLMLLQDDLHVLIAREDAALRPQSPPPLTPRQWADNALRYIRRLV